MRAKLVTAAVLLSTAFAAARSGPRPALYEGLGFSRVVTARDGRFLRLEPAPDGRYRLWTPLSEFSPLLVEATRIEREQAGGDLALALARRLAGDSAGPARLRFAAWRLRVLYAQDELLEGYLNLSPYGPAVDGAAAASLLYFGKNPDQLTLTEAMELSVIPDHPIRATLTGQGNPDDRKARAKAKERLMRRWASRGAKLRREGV